MIDCVVTTAGGIEEDFIKCMGDFYIGIQKNICLGSFNVDDVQYRKNAFNRIGNMFLPSKNYCMFEDWLTPIL